MDIEGLLEQLNAQRDAYLDTVQRVHEALARTLAASENPATSPDGHTLVRQPRSISTVEPRIKSSSLPSTFDNSTLSDDSENEDNESYYVHDTLPSQSFDYEQLREHLRTYQWDEYGRQILASLIADGEDLKHSSLFPAHHDPDDDKSHHSHYQVFDVGPDGAPLQIYPSGLEKTMPRANMIWHAIKDINADTARQQHAVGRIIIAGEPSPVLFGALHLTMDKSFNMDELFKHLVESEASSANVDRAFSEDQRQQRSFVFNLEYYTIVGEDCRPMAWQLAEKQHEASESHMLLSRCSSVVALSLYGEPVRKIRNPARKAKTRHGYVYNLWAPWQVLNIQCYPDWKSTTDTHDSTKRYVNGPEAFFYTLLAEYRDAQKRFEEIYRRITKLITPPLDFIFNDELRDNRLFEDKDFTYTRRYFWAHQTLGTMNDSIKAMIDAFEDTFTEDVWEGKHKTLWPLLEESPRNDFWKRRMRSLRRDFEREMQSLRTLIKENNDRRTEIRGLRDQLFSGTSVLESRKSVELSAITIQQGHNIKLLTLVNIFFLPLTFVTSVFGMTNMPINHGFWEFGAVMATVCVPFFLLIGSLNTTKGYEFWNGKMKIVWRLVSGGQGSKAKAASSNEEANSNLLDRSLSVTEAMAIRLGESSNTAESNGCKAEAIISSDRDEVKTGEDDRSAAQTTAESRSRRNVNEMHAENYRGFFERVLGRRRAKVAYKHSV